MRFQSTSLLLSVLSWTHTPAVCVCASLLPMLPLCCSELRERIQPEILELIKQQRLNRLCEGSCFRKLGNRRRQGINSSPFLLLIYWCATLWTQHHFSCPFFFFFFSFFREILVLQTLAESQSVALRRPWRVAAGRSSFWAAQRQEWDAS